MANTSVFEKPRVIITLGDPCGIGPELIVKLLSQERVRERARIVVIGDYSVFQIAERVAGMTVQVNMVSSMDEVDMATYSNIPYFLQPADLMLASEPDMDITTGTNTASAGRLVLRTLDAAVELTRVRAFDAMMFAPLNKQSMAMGGSKHEDELHRFAEKLDIDLSTHYFCELNVLGSLWTSRVTSHVALKDVAQHITAYNIGRAIDLAHSTLASAGYENPRVAVAGLNPHNGDGGLFGREEIDEIGPAVEAAKARGVNATGPFPSDTVFLKAKAGQVDAVVTMYHDQGQIAMKLMGFEKGVTVQGGLTVPITTPAHGTAFDIAGKGMANVDAQYEAFELACRMGERRAADSAAKN